MYKIINVADGTELGKVEKPIYIKIKESSGARVRLKADEPLENAQGIAYKDTAYNLHGKDGIGADITVFLIEIDAGEQATANAAAIAANSAAIDQLVISLLEV